MISITTRSLRRHIDHREVAAKFAAMIRTASSKSWHPKLPRRKS
jgi:hypothetical protein